MSASDPIPVLSRRSDPDMDFFLMKVCSGSGFFLAGRIRIWCFPRRSYKDQVFLKFQIRRMWIRVKPSRIRNPAGNPSVIVRGDSSRDSQFQGIKVPRLPEWHDLDTLLPVLILLIWTPCTWIITTACSLHLYWFNYNNGIICLRVQGRLYI